MKLYQTAFSCLIEEENRFYVPNMAFGGLRSWDSLVARARLYAYLQQGIRDGEWTEGARPAQGDLRAPIGTQEVWAAGVTYYRSREARIEESKSAGGGDFYDRVYDAERPEIFFKASPHRVVGPGGKVAIRDDSSWSVPEPELALLISPQGDIVGYTVGNDMSSRSIEGENPLYLPLPMSTEISMEIFRGGSKEFAGTTLLSSMKRDLAVLVKYLYRNNSFPSGCFLLTGTGIVPPDSFTLQGGDEIRITIVGIGALINTVG